MPSPTRPLNDKSPNRRQQASDRRRQAILDAGLEVFAAHGFAASRLDDVAEKAGVAKGTIYLSFKDKQDLFEQIVLGAAAPVFVQLSDVVTHADLPARDVLTKIFELFRTEVLGTRRKEVLRLVVAEGARFPKIAQFYHREVLSKGIEITQRLAQRAYERGEVNSDSLEKFPHLVFAPLLLAIIWDGVFAKIAPLDVEGLLAAHIDILLGSASRRRRPK